MKKKQLELDIILGRTEMDYYILSIESIMKKPEILYQSHECNLILPDFIYDEIHKLATKSFYFKEVINVIDESDITIEETDIAVNSSML